MNTGSDKQGPLRISLILIVFFLLFNAPISSLYGKDRFSSKGKDRIVVVDPGHGGKDWGAVGPRGAKEKNISLIVAILVKRELEEKGGFNVVLTRLTDRFLAIDERYRIANKAKADCLISLHVNGYFTPKAKGIRSYYLAFLKDETNKDYSGSSRPSGRKGTSQSGEDEVVRLILKDLTWTERINQGGRLARAIGMELAFLPEGSHREVSQIVSPVLLGAQMPACLVELGFITNPSEEKRLRDRSYCKSLAKAIARGIVAFLRSH